MRPARAFRADRDETPSMSDAPSAATSSRPALAARADTAPATSADIIARRLREAGVRHAFGVPGGEVLGLIAALERNGIRFHLARHENAAGFMAEAAWHATGAPGVLVATVGPGLANAVNVTANAQQDRVPLIVISGRIPEAEALTYSHQVMDHQAVLRPLAKASFEARAGDLKLLWSGAGDGEWMIQAQSLEQPSTPRYDALVPGFGQESPSSETFLYEPNRRSLLHGRYRGEAGGSGQRRGGGRGGGGRGGLLL